LVKTQDIKGLAERGAKKQSPALLSSESSAVSEKKSIKSVVEISKVFICESAHRLPYVPQGHKCGRLHGHSFRIEIWVRGQVEDETGWVMDFADLGQVFQPIYQQLDHHYLNEIEGLFNPTSENLAGWIWQQLRPSLPLLHRVGVSETCTSGCMYQGDEE